MTKRISKKVIGGIDIIQFEEALSQYADADARESEIITKLERDMKRIKSNHLDELNYLTAKKKQTLEVVETYCREQKSKIFNKKRTLHTIYGAVGFRLGNPKLKTPRGSSWNLILQTLKEKLPAYIRVTEEPAKDLLIADRHKDMVATVLQDMGLQVIQDEIFFVDIKPLISKIIPENK
jgi:phage host-nuclease inhibitor protein Gam